MGAIGGSLWHGVIMGWPQAPRGMRMSSAITALKTKAPSLGGSFAVWGGLYSSFDCTFAYLRGKEDFKNSIMSGAATGAVLAARTGWKGSLKSGVVGGGLLALIEGIVFVISRQSPAAQQDFGYAPPPPPLEDVLDVEDKGGFFSGLSNLFSKKEESKPLEMEEEMTMDEFGQETKEDDFGDFFQPPPTTAWEESWNTEEKEHA
jgi:import inner membrane translocase subunit TIM17